MTSIIGKYEVNELLIKEREKTSFGVTRLTYFLEGNQEKTERRKELEKKFYEDQFPTDLITLPIDYLDHKGIYEEACIKASKLYFEAFNLEDPRDILTIADSYHYEASPLLLHFAMFIPALMGHCNDEQQSQWLPDAIELRIIGTYAQTELGHGSYLKGLQTRADYDKESETFTLNTPTLESIKWWPGGLGKTANHAIVLAQLYIDNKLYGLHPFMVQLRDMETHKPLPGIFVGEIGPKMGFKAADNGYLQLRNVKIPRTNMLMKNAIINEKGEYVAKKDSEKLNLGTMLFVRVVVIDMISQNVAKAATIATRYSAVRRQGPDPDAPPTSPDSPASELQIIDYQSQMYKLIPCIAMSHAFKAAFIWLMTSFKDVNESMETTGDLGKIPLLHAMSSGLKAITSDMGSAAIELCRKACGGHGFLLMSGFPRLYANTVAACTYEGENTILYLQTAKYLYKRARQLTAEERQDRDMIACVGYLFNSQRPVVNLNDDFTSPAVLINLLSISAHYYVYRCFEAVETFEKRFSPDKAWIMAQNYLIKAAKSHLIFNLLRIYHEWTQMAKTHGDDIHRILCKLSLFYICHVIVENSGDFLVVGLSEQVLTKINQLMLDLMSGIRPDMVPLVDAFDLHDVVLMSALGCYDGAVYQRLFDLAKKSPLNKDDPNPSFIKYIKELTKSKL